MRELESEKYALTESLHKLQTTVQRDRDSYEKEMEEVKTRIIRKYEQHAEVMEKKV